MPSSSPEHSRPARCRATLAPSAHERRSRRRVWKSVWEDVGQIRRLVVVVDGFRAVCVFSHAGGPTPLKRRSSLLGMRPAPLGSAPSMAGRSARPTVEAGRTEAHRCRALLASELYAYYMHSWRAVKPCDRSTTSDLPPPETPTPSLVSIATGPRWQESHLVLARARMSPSWSSRESRSTLVRWGASRACGGFGSLSRR